MHGAAFGRLLKMFLDVVGQVERAQPRVWRHPIGILSAMNEYKSVEPDVPSVSLTPSTLSKRKT